MKGKSWSEKDIKELRERYFYYNDHKEEAKNIFKRSQWTNEQLNNLKEKYFYYIEHKKEAENYFQRNWLNISVKASLLGITSIKINKKCSLFLGCYVAERVLSHIYKDVERMPIHNPGYDFICNKGYKIDVKSSIICKNHYKFLLRQNKIADYFLLIGFDNRKDLNPQHIWLIKGEFVNEVKALTITNSIYGMCQLSDYELTDKLKDVIKCCNNLKENKN